MFKISFKEDFKKIQTFNGKATVVTLTGNVIMPEWADLMPREITDWITLHPSVEVENHWKRDHFSMTLIASGKSVCAEEDNFDPVLGERIAEARAKLRLYKFIYTLCKKLQQYYIPLLFGVSGIKVDKGLRALQTDCISLALEKYQALMIKESHHLGELLEQA